MVWTFTYQPKDKDRMANSVDPDQTALADLGLHCLPRPVRKIRIIVVNVPCHEKICLLFATRYDSNQPATRHKLARVLKFQIYQVLYYLGSEQQRRWSDCGDAPLLFAYGTNRFSHEVAQILMFSYCKDLSSHSILIVCSTLYGFLRTNSKNSDVPKDGCIVCSVVMDWLSMLTIPSCFDCRRYISIVLKSRILSDLTCLWAWKELMHLCTSLLEPLPHPTHLWEIAGRLCFDFCFTALQHILGHFGRGQLP